jgi:ribosomal-protein-alanine N-acetyltransferase
MSNMTTDRLVLEPLTMQHSAGMFALWSNPKVCKYSGSADDVDGNPIRLPAEEATDSDKIIAFFLQFQHRSEKVRWAMMTKSERKFIGALGFNSLAACSELAYHLNPDYWGQGYMNEACRTVNAWAKSTMRSESVQAFISPDNIGSIKLIRALGFQPTGVFRDGAERYLLS